MAATATGPFRQATRGYHETRSFYSGARQDYDQDIVSVVKEDFFTYPNYVTATTSFAGTTAAHVAPWLILFSGAGTSQGAAIQDAAGGILKLTSDSTSASKGEIMTIWNEVFIPTAGKTAWAKARVALEDVDKSSFFFGLAKRPTLTAGTTYVNVTAASNPKIGFGNFTASSTALSWISSATGTSSATCTTLTDSGYVTLGIRVNGVSSVDFYLGDNLVTTVSTANNMPSEELSIFFEHTNDTAAAATTQSLFIDYVQMDVTR